MVQKIAKDNRIYLGQILAGTQFENFRDAAYQNSRLKQYQIEKYLKLVDDGWIFRKARYYRGSIQAEDEENRGLGFLTWVVSHDEILDSQFFLVRQACKDIPHMADDDRLNKIRALSKTVSDSLQAFIDLRVKIHGQPDAGDLQRVRDFRARNQREISADIDQSLRTLEKEMELAYQHSDIQSLTKYYDKLYNKLPSESNITVQLKRLINTHSSSQNPEINPDAMNTDETRIKETAELLWNIRSNLSFVKKPLERLTLIDLSDQLEDILFRNIQGWSARTIYDLLEKNYTL